MLEVGIDEAGYGPLLGPLVVGLTAFRLDAAEATLAERLRGVVVRRPRRLHPTLPVAVDDSKTIHRRFGREGLARSVALFDAVQDRSPATRLGAFLAGCSDVPASVFTARPWYARIEDVPLPPTPDLPPLGRRLARRGVEAVALRIRPVDAPLLNAEFDRTDNKARVLGLVAGACLLRLLEACPDEDVRVCFDRHGGRLDYHAYLSDLFPFARITARAAPRGEAHYDVELARRRLDVRFATRGDAKYLPIAWASTAAKLARELFMDCLNAYFVGKTPGLRPTAGYVRDGRRFLDELEPLLAAEGIAPHHLVRTR